MRAWEPAALVPRPWVCGAIAYDFDLPVPPTGCPSHDLGATVVSYLVVGAIDRPMRGDYTVTQWVSLHNA